MQNVNVAVITGNLTHDPQPRTTAGGTKVTGLRVAVNGRRPTAEGWVDTVDYVNVSVWGARGEACAKHLAKGRAVAVEGRLDWRASGEGDERREYLQIVAGNVQFLGPKPGEAPAGDSAEDDAPAQDEAPAQDQMPVAV